MTPNERAAIVAKIQRQARLSEGRAMTARLYDRGGRRDAAAVPKAAAAMN